MKGPFVNVECPLCGQGVKVALPTHATLMDVRADHPEPDETYLYLGILHKKRGVQCPDGHTFGVLWTQQPSSTQSQDEPYYLEDEYRPPRNAAEARSKGSEG
jgi:hypothetical protein